MTTARRPPPLDAHSHVGTAKPHPCPYKAEIYDDEKTKCRCCDDCQQECRDDI